jgi:hypothetical protein
MEISGTRKTLWLWLRERGGHWTVQDIARRTGMESAEIFRAVHAMTRRQLVEQLDAAPGEHRKRYGVTDDCLVPLGLTVHEATTGLKTKPKHAEAVAAAICNAEVKRAIAQLPSLDLSTGIGESERAYSHMAHRLGARQA